MDYHTTKTVLNGEAYRESAVLAAIYGNPEISFGIASLDGNNVRKQKAIITESHKNILIGVNGKAVVDYLEEIGLTKDDLALGLPIMPLVVEHADGTPPVARAVYALTPEGHAVCGGSMPEGAALAIGRLDKNDVLHTTETALTSFANDGGALLCYSCMSRYIALGTENRAEAEIVKKSFGTGSHIFACSAGEICPIHDENGQLKNYFHNFSIVFCKIQ
jgi:hypothetical protein